MTAYATRADLYKYGLPRGTLAGEGRIVASSTASTDLLELEDHGFVTDDAVIVRATAGGTLSAPLVAGTTYYVIRVSDSTFKLAATPGGSAINLTSDGSSVLVAVALPVDDVLEFYSRFVDAFIDSTRVPLSPPYPVTVTALVSELAARKLQLIAGVISGSMAEIELSAKAQLERWAVGVAEPDIAPSMLAVVSTASDTSDSRGWGSGSLP